jgi:UDP-N-acetylmuramoylalanine-D-glutamate ligase
VIAPTSSVMIPVKKRSFALTCTLIFGDRAEAQSCNINSVVAGSYGTISNLLTGTNVDSTLRALESFPEPIVLIAGGKGKGQDFTPLAAAARGHVAHAILIGEDAAKIGAALRDAAVPVTFSPSMPEAVERARALATPGTIVLLSPACASFDMFDNFEHRGDVFKKLVERLD